MDHFNSDVPEATFDQLTKSQQEVLDKAAPHMWPHVEETVGT